MVDEGERVMERMAVVEGGAMMARVVLAALKRTTGGLDSGEVASGFPW